MSKEPPKDVRATLAAAGKQAVRDLAENAEEWKNEEPEAQATSGAFPLTRASDISKPAEIVDIVEKLLTAGGASVLYGASNTAKTFLVLDIEAAIATGQPFRDDLRVERGAVIHVALEGEAGITNRVLALKKSGKLPDTAELYLCYHPISLLSPPDRARLVDTVNEAARRASLPVRLVVIDTLSRAMAGGDENGAGDMTMAVSEIDAIRAATGAHVMLVHHCGKDEARGARGHSSLRAAVDTEIEVSRDDASGISTAFITKQRDLPKGEPMPYRLKVVELGTDRRGEDITSCIIQHEDASLAATRGKKGRGKTYHADQLLGLLPAKNVKEWQAAVMNETGMSRSNFYDLKAELKSRGAFYESSAGLLKS